MMNVEFLFLLFEFLILTLYIIQIKLPVLYLQAGFETQTAL
jgi:hypothetical protein